MTYREVLPDSCPPQAVNAPTVAVLWRLLKSDAICDGDFDSTQQRNLNKTFPNPCEARSVSLVPELAQCKTIAKSPRMRHFLFAVPVTHDAQAGTWHQDTPTHVHWWVYHNTSPLTLVGQIEKLHD
ncbi:hypothetical protein [Rhodoferax ferrireducens]|uniref:hypothetical protein n=1 Tax=Rhodoferax ferrireducens TaxID=192843 RepID=UPI00286C35E8|nr:hypothetical protein [Rhodoferax ferrireducens]